KQATGIPAGATDRREVSSRRSMNLSPSLRSGAPVHAVVAAGAATLFVELALIRYVPGQIRVLGYFTNFVLLAAFLGLGIGMIAAQRWPTARVPSYLAPGAL